MFDRHKKDQRQFYLWSSHLAILAARRPHAGAGRGDGLPLGLSGAGALPRFGAGMPVFSAGSGFRGGTPGTPTKNASKSSASSVSTSISFFEMVCSRSL